MYPSVHRRVSNAHTISAGTSSRTGPETFSTSVTSPVYSCLISNSWDFLPKHSKTASWEKSTKRKSFRYFSSFYLISASVINIDSQCNALFMEAWKRFKKALWFLISASWTPRDYFISKCEHLQACAYIVRSRLPLTLFTSHMWHTNWTHPNAQYPPS